MPKIPYPYEVNGKLVTGNGSLIPICSLSNHSLLSSLTVPCLQKKGFPSSYLFEAYILRKPLKALNNSILDSNDQFRIFQTFQKSPILQSWERLLEAQYILLALLVSTCGV